MLPAVTHRLLTPPGQLARIPGLYNLTTDAVRNSIAAFRQTKQGVADSWVGFQGDSTTAGFGATAIDGWTGGRVLAAPAKVASALNTAGITALADSCWGTANTTVMPAYYGNITYGTNWADGTVNTSLGNHELGLNSGLATADVMTITSISSTAFDKVSVTSYSTATSGTFSVSFDGGSTFIAGGGGTGSAGLQTQTFTSLTGTTTSLQIQKTSGNTTTVGIQGVRFWKNGTPKLQMENMGWAGSKTADWTFLGNAYSTGNQYYKQGNCLVFLNLLINDCTSTTNPDTGNINKLSLMFNFFKKWSIDVILVLPAITAGGNEANQQSYRAAQMRLCQAYRVPVLDMSFALPTNAAWSAQSYMYDTLHCNAAGYNYEGGLMAAVVQAIWNAS